MLTSSCCKVWFMVTIIFVVNKNGFCKISPCPNIFKHIFDGSGWFGTVSLDSSPPGEAFKLIVEMSGSGNTPKNYQYIGEADLKINQKDEKMEYKIKFPISPAYSKLSKIVVNDHVVCSQPTVGNPIVTVLRFALTGAGQITFDTSVTGITKPLLMEDSKKTNIETSNIKNQDNNRNEGSIYTNCGQVNEAFEQSLASNSRELEEGIWPWLAAVVIQSYYKCAGTLITNNAVLTAARCVTNLEGAYVHVYLGLQDLDTVNQTSFYLTNIDDKLEEQGILHSYVHTIHEYPKYQSGQADGDIAVLRLEVVVEFSDIIQPACLWAGSTELKDIVGKYGYYAGWNEPKNDTKADTPFRLASEIISQENCYAQSSNLVKSTSTRSFCAIWDYKEREYPVYRGTGFLIENNKKWVLRGIMLGLPSDKDKRFVKLAVYTDVAQYLDWIKEKI